MFIHMLGYPTHFGQMETLKAHCCQRLSREGKGATYTPEGLQIESRQKKLQCRAVVNIHVMAGL